MALCISLCEFIVTLYSHGCTRLPILTVEAALPPSYSGAVPLPIQLSAVFREP